MFLRPNSEHDSLVPPTELDFALLHNTLVFGHFLLVTSRVPPEVSE